MYAAYSYNPTTYSYDYKASENNTDSYTNRTIMADGCSFSPGKTKFLSFLRKKILGNILVALQNENTIDTRFVFSATDITNPGISTVFYTFK